MDLAQFSELLSGFASADNDIRQQAEHAFNTFKTQNPNGAFLLVIQTLRSSEDEQQRLQSAILIRNLLGGFLMHSEQNIWGQLSTETKDLVKTTLLSCLDTEQASRVRSNVCDTISDIGKDLVPERQWDELCPKLFSMVNSDDFVQQRSSLRILGELATTLSQDLTQYPKGVTQIVAKCMTSQDPFVRHECMGFITNIVEDGNKPVWKTLCDAVPHIMESLNMMVESNFDSAGEFLQYLIRLVEANLLFLKPHLAMVADKLFDIAYNDHVEVEYRQYTVEALICIAENKPKLAIKLPQFVARMVDVLMKFMLDIKEEKYTAWLDSGEEDHDDEQRNYDVGEEGIDRIAKAFYDLPDGGDVITTVYSLVGQFLNRSEWQYRFVGIMATSQTVEYIPEETVEDHLEHIMKMLLQHLKDQDRHVRFAACQAIGQVSLDHQPYVQEKFHMDVMPALIEAMDDPHHRVQSHAAAAFVNFSEEVEKPNMLPYVDVVMQKLLSRINLQTPRLVREQAITAVAVVAAVVEEHFIKYYATIMPLMKDVIQNCLLHEERTCRGKAIECISIIGLSVGEDKFLADGQEVMNALLQIAGSGLEDDDPVKEYLQEALGRMCRALRDNFVVYLPHLMPGLLEVLSAQPKAVTPGDAERDDEDMTMVMVADNKCVGLKTSMIEDQERALDLLSTFVEVLGIKCQEWIMPIFKALLPLLSYVLSDDVKQKALNTMAELMEAARNIVDLYKEESQKQTLLAMLVSASTLIFKNLEDAHDRSAADLEIMVAEATGLNDCIQKAGPGILPQEDLKHYCERVFCLLKMSSERRAEYAIRKHEEDMDEEEIENLEEEEQQEQNLRSALLEIQGTFMEHYPKEFFETAATPCIEFVHAFLQPGCHADDRALALYVCDDILAHLGDIGVPLWDGFMPNLILSITDDDSSVRQAACYGVVKASSYPAFAKYAEQAATRLSYVIKHPQSTKGKDNTAATDNAVAAIGDLVFRHAKNLSDVDGCLKLWLEYLPLKQDDEEARRVHAELVDHIEANNFLVLGASNENVPRLVGVMATIYRTPFSTPKVDEKTRSLLGRLGSQYISSIQNSLTKKQQKKIERIFRDIENIPHGGETSTINNAATAAATSFN